MTGSLPAVATTRLSVPPDVARPEQSRPRHVRRLGKDARELIQARELTLNLVRRDLKVRHRGSFLGMLWSLTNPLLVVGLYYVIFTYILQTRPASDPDGTTTSCITMYGAPVLSCSVVTAMPRPHR